MRKATHLKIVPASPSTTPYRVPAATGIKVHLARAQGGQIANFDGRKGMSLTLCGANQSKHEQVIADHASPDMCGECLKALPSAGWTPYPNTIVGII